MDIIDLLYKLKLDGGSLSVLGEDLIVSLRKGYKSIDPKLIYKIKENKKDIIDYLKDNISTPRRNSIILKSEKRDYYNPTSIQKRFYNLQKIDSQSIAYNIASAIEIIGKFDYIAFSEALNKTINQNDILKGFFIEHDENIYFKTLREVKLQLEVESLSNRDVQNLIKEFIEPIDLNAWPLYRFKLYYINDNKYIFLIDFHHSIMDGFSLNLFIGQLICFYQKGNVNPTKLQYIDLLGKQSTYEYQALLDLNNDYWEKKFCGELPVLDIPTDFLRPLFKDTKGNIKEFKFEKDDFSLLREAMKSTETTLNMILIACYNILLHKYTEQEDIIVGVVSSGRENSDVKYILGLMIETIPLRNFPEPDKTIGLFIQEVKKCIIDSFENQPYPFENIMKLSSNKRDISRNPIFDTMLIVQNLDKVEISIEGLEIKQITFGAIESKLDVEIDVLQKADELIFSVTYRTSLFQDKTIENLIERFFSIIKFVSNVAKDSAILNKKIKEISILNREEKIEILNSFNNTKDLSPDKNYIELFANSAQKHKDRIALEDNNGFLTYGQIQEMSDGIAILLASEYNIRQGDFVGIMLYPCNEMIINILSIYKLGAVYVPLNVELPITRINEIATDCSLKLIVAENILNIDADSIIVSKNILFENTFKNLGRLQPNLLSLLNPVYLFYTSGSSGRPKGVLVSHLSFVDYVITFLNYYHLNSNDIIIQQSSNSFDTSIEEIFPMLLSGGKIIVLKHGARDIEEIIKTINVKNANILSTVPLVINELDKFSQKIVGLKALISGGDILKTSFINNLILHNPIYNTYGPTEATVCATYKRVDSLNDEGNIGAPIRNRNVMILDKNNDLCPIGLRGEICIGGKGVAIGYLNQPELSAEKFINNPFNNNEIIYKTGDFGSWNEDGGIKFLGRKDFQVKLRGIRIELGEIEKCIEKYPEINEALVTISGESQENSRLIGYFTSKIKLDHDKIREFLLKKLPTYMIPDILVSLDAFPRTGSGKIDRKVLPEPVLNNRNYVRPFNEIEEKLVEVWSEVLKIDKEQISVTNNFFELGGHSLKATLLVSGIYKDFNIKLELKQVFKHTTIKGQAELLKTITVESKENLSIKATEKREYYSLSSAQKRMYIAIQMDKSNSTYNMHGAYELEGSFQIKRFEEVFGEIIQRHEILRTSFEMIQDKVVQRILSKFEFKIEIFELNDNDIETVLDNFIRPFDLTQPPLLRVGLISVNSEKCILMFDMPHIVSDGISMSILMKDFIMLLAGNSLPAIKLQYKDFVAYQEMMISSGDYKKMESFWYNKFKNELSVLSLPYDFLRPKTRSMVCGDKVYAKIDKELHLLIKNAINDLDVTLYMFMLAAYNVLIYKYTRQEDVIVGTLVTGRSNSDLGQTVGMFVNMLAMRNYPVKTKSFLEFINEVKDNVIEAFEYQEYQFDELIMKLNIQGSGSRNPLFDTNFQMDNFERFAMEIPGIKVSSIDLNRDFAKFDLHVIISEKEDCVDVLLRYSTELFERSTINNLMNDYLSILKQFTEDYHIKINDITLDHGLSEVKSNVFLQEAPNFEF